MSRAGPTAAAHPNIFRFWYPLAAQWLMMSLEGPYLAAIIARTADPAFNLAAHGIAHAFAILVESPVIMLMSAATALVENAASYRRLRAFANALNIGATLLMVIALIPPVHDALMGGLLGLPPQITELVYGALWLMLPWPAAIGYRRFLHGLLIRSGRTRLVAMGTIFRLVGMTSTALILFSTTDLPGAWVGASALSASVVIEALVTRLLASGVLRELLAEPAHRAIEHAPPEKEAAAVVGVPTEEAEALPGVIATPHPSATDAPSYGEIARFYYPLALTSFIGLSVQPMLTFFMGRAAQPIGSLAVYPVVHALAFLFRAVGFSFQEVVIALSGRRRENVAALRKFGIGLAAASSGALALVVFTPLVHVWFRSVSGLTPDLAALAVAPARISVLLPAMAVLVAYQHGLLVQGRRTRPITVGTVIELIGIGVLFVIFGWSLGLTGVTAALLALVGGRLAGNLYLKRHVKQTVKVRG